MKTLKQELIEYIAGVFPKQCTCCNKVYSEQEWLKLNLVGNQNDFDGTPWGELRDCSCGSTLVARLSH